MKVYLSLSNTCAVCDRALNLTQHIGLYMASEGAALAYFMCGSCGEIIRHGTQPDVRIALDQKLTRAAEQLSSAVKHEGLVQ